MTRTVRALLDYGVERFERAGLSYGHGTANALDEAAWIILSSLGFPPAELEAHLDRPLPEARYRKARALLGARVRTRKPAAYLLNEAWLGPYKFYVDERVIVPRSFIAELLRHPRTRELAGWIPATAEAAVLDLCTGSGCLAILAALAWPGARVDAADLSDDALEVAKRNVADYKLSRRVRLVKSDLFGALATRRYDLIVSNPPYVKSASMRKLPDEFRKEPEMALASGSDGLDHTRRILAKAREHLNPGGLLVVEIGHNRAALERAYPSYPFRWPKVAAGAGYVFTLAREDLP
ncbi:MAG TPA: 50S ribosomal protein L3 N(5)-glutamine methyltransferase [Usitatibacter sp.]|jgi:ribosomal protein L3 glutamine methyltransferase|nr:50S ribosomal protein L3 N(5)-glutamine methyltransferase [Usitatibacter sp.]